MNRSSAQSNARGKNHWPEWLAAIALLATIIAAFWPAFSAGFILDDDVMVTDNPLIRGPLKAFWFTTKPIDYFPLTYTTFWFEWRLWGMDPRGYHIVNVVLHAASCLFLWRVFERLKFPAAWLAALLFAVHPVNVESVAWVAERKNVLAMFFYSIAAWSFVRFIQSQQKRFYAVSIFAFIFSLLAKPAAAAWPMVAFGIAWWASQTSENPGHDRRSQWRTFWVCCLQIAPLLAVTLLLSPLTVWFQYYRAIGHGIQHYHFPSFWTRAAAAGSVPWFYLWKALIPCGLTLNYPKWNIDPHSLIVWLPWIALVGLFALLWSFRNSWSKFALLALTYFLLLLFPVLGFFNMASHLYCYVADRWQYFALPAVTVLIAAALKKMNVERIAGVCIALLFFCLTFAQSRVYRDGETLWSDALRKNPSSWLALNGLAFDRQSNGRLDEAIALNTRSLQLQPEQSDPHASIGDALMKQGKVDEATAQFREAIRIDPEAATAHYNLGFALQQQGKLDEAIAEYREAVRSHPDWPHGHYNLATALQEQRKFDDAIAEYRRTLETNPDHMQAHNSLGCLLVLRGNYEEGIAEMRRAVALEPNFPDALLNLGTSLNAQQKPADGLPFLKKAVALAPTNGLARVNLGNTLISLNQISAARDQFTAALELNAANDQALYGLATCAMRSSQTNDAIKLYEQVLTTNPNHAESHFQIAMLQVADNKKKSALTHLRQAVRLKPSWPEAVNNLAWFLAVDPDSSAADRAQAVRLAEHAVELTASQNAVAFDTLGVAWARNEIFTKASEAAARALQLANQTGQTNLSTEIQKRVALYNQRRAYLEP